MTMGNGPVLLEALPANESPADEPALVRAAAAGDACAFKQIYRRHQRRIFGL